MLLLGRQLDSKQTTCNWYSITRSETLAIYSKLSLESSWQRMMFNLPNKVSIKSLFLFISQGFQIKSQPNINKEKYSIQQADYQFFTNDICGALCNLVSVTIWCLYDPSNSLKCMLLSFSTYLPSCYLFVRVSMAS